MVKRGIKLAGCVFLCLALGVVDQTEGYTRIYCVNKYLYLRCPGTIAIQSAQWGRTSYACPSGNYRGTTNCVERLRATQILKSLCNGKPYCHKRVTTQVFGDPCPGVSKYLQVVYSCRPLPTPPTIGPPVVRSVSGCKTPGSKADIYFVVDSSGSIRSQNFVYILRFINFIINGLPIGKDEVRVGLIRYSSAVQLIFPLDRYYNKKVLRHVVRSLPYRSGGTATSNALKMLMKRGFTRANGDRPKVHNIAFLITDGVPNSQKRTQTQANICKRAGVEFFIVAAQAPAYTVRYLKTIAHTVHAHYHVLPKFHLMQSRAAGIGKELCKSVNKFSPPSKGCKQNVPADIYFMLDSSGSVTIKNFPLMLKFVNAIIDRLPLGFNATRVGVYRYQHRVDLLIPLNKYYNKVQLKQAVLAIKYSKGMTFTDQVLKQMRTSGFTPKNGARKGVLDIGVLITDGLSTFRTKTLQETKLCKKAGIQLFAIGVAVSSDVEIKAIGSKPRKDHVFTIKHFPDLLHRARDIHHKICDNINKAKRKSVCKKDRQIDLYFVIDSSENLQKKNFPKAIAFADRVIQHLPIGQTNIRVGVMIYDFVAKLIFPLNKYYSAATLRAALRGVKYTGGGCSIFDALKEVRSTGFTAKNGDRAGVHNMVILISSGIPYGYQQTLTEASATKKAGIELFIVGVALPTKSKLPQLASSPTKEHYLHVNKPDQLTTKGFEYSKRICERANKISGKKT